MREGMVAGVYGYSHLIQTGQCSAPFLCAIYDSSQRNDATHIGEGLPTSVNPNFVIPAIPPRHAQHVVSLMILDPAKLVNIIHHSF